MDKSKVSPQEIYEILEEQKKLQEVKSKLVSMLEKVNQTINSLAVENLQLTQCIDLSDNEEQSKPKEIKPEMHASPSDPPIRYNQLEQSEIINQQMAEIDIKPCFDEIDSDEELEHL